MKNFWINSLLFFTIAFMSNMLFSASNENCCCERAQGYIIDGNKMNSAYNAPAKLCLHCPIGLYLEGSFLWWEARESGLNMAMISDADEKIEFIKIPFTYKPGFKIEAGFIWCQDNWHADFQYTRFLSEKEISESKDFMYPLWTVPPSPSDHMLTIYTNCKWKFNLDMIDVSLGRPFYAGVKFTLHPFFGLKAGWIDQKIYASYSEYMPLESPNMVEVSSSSSSWAIGPRAGVITDFILISNFKLFGRAAASVLYQDFELKFQQTRQTFSDVSSQKKVGFINPFLEMAFGISWGAYLSDRGCHFDLFASYDFNILWDQNILRSNIDSIKKYVDGTSGDLMLHGFTLAVRIDF